MGDTGLGPYDMPVLVPLRSHWMNWALPCLLVLVAPTKGRDLELTGVYEDEGTVAVAAPGRTDEVVSLHALLSLEFVPGLAKILHDRTSLVRVKHLASVLEVQVVDREGETTWQEIWKEGADFKRQGDALLLHFRPGRKDKEEFVLTLQTLTAFRLLQVEVRRLTPTLLGPLSHPMGTYLFHRLE